MISGMTTIAGLEGIDYAVLVADSQITEDNLVTLATSTPKIVEAASFSSVYQVTQDQVTYSRTTGSLRFIVVKIQYSLWERK
jgi:hypothetical protein